MKWKTESDQDANNIPERRKVKHVLALRNPIADQKSEPPAASTVPSGVFRLLTERPQTIRASVTKPSETSLQIAPPTNIGPQVPVTGVRRTASRNRTPLRVDPSAVKLPIPNAQNRSRLTRSLAVSDLPSGPTAGEVKSRIRPHSITDTVQKLDETAAVTASHKKSIQTRSDPPVGQVKDDVKGNMFDTAVNTPEPHTRITTSADIHTSDTARLTRAAVLNQSFSAKSDSGNSTETTATCSSTVQIHRFGDSKRTGEIRDNERHKCTLKRSSKEEEDPASLKKLADSMTKRSDEDESYRKVSKVIAKYTTLQEDLDTNTFVDASAKDKQQSKTAPLGATVSSDPSGERMNSSRASSPESSSATGSSSSTFKLTDSAHTRSAPMSSSTNDTGQNLTLLSGDPLSRASSPGSSSYNLSSGASTEFSGHMGSTTGLIEQKDTKVPHNWMPGLRTTLAILSLAAGFSNVVRLPRAVFLNGGGVFLVIYICITLILGIPLVFLEIGLGQLCQKGTTKLWKAVPIFKGVGYVKVLVTTLMSIYYPVFMAISLFYVVWIARGPMPFQECRFDMIPSNLTGEECLRATFLKSILDDPMWFGVNVAFLFLLWALCILFIFKGRDFYISMFVALTPVLICLIVLFLESLLNDPSARGLQMLMTFNWDILLNIQVWYFAVIQVFFSTHLGFGNIVTCAGGLYPQSNAFRTAVWYVIMNLLIGILAVFIVYLWIGRLNLNNADPSIPDLTEMFVFSTVYDVAINCMGSYNQVWSALAFVAILFAGFATMITLLYTILVAFPLKNVGKWHWWHGTCFVCAIGFVVGIPCLIPKDLQLVHILDHYVIGRMVLASTVLELIAFAWIYGCKALYIDFEFILGQRLNPTWKIMWIISPVLLTMVEIWSLVSLPLNGVVEKADDPVWVYATGWTFYSCMWIIVVIAGIYEVHIQVDYNFFQKFKSALKASRNWGPSDPKHRHDWVQWRFTNSTTGRKDFTFKRRGTKEFTRSAKKAIIEPLGSHYKNASSPSSNGTPYTNRTINKGPFTIQQNGNLPEHVCWRGSTQINGGHST